ncbi:uncharacterized protein LOC115664291 [Syzygium oleosum]|uniref:uncharacterized protein LOC115664291 n=1 Tax=Syzygium oleosum TaxID=219896 RepID=UPI0024BA3388|nr:uncharacterized protein LOC115664291 [Syzygium oleosum]
MVKTAMTGASRNTTPLGVMLENNPADLSAQSSNGGEQFSQNSNLLLTVHRLNGQNYLEWAQSVKLAIDGRGKLGHLTGEVKEPEKSNPSWKIWRFENSLVIAWLINSMEPTIGKPHLFLPTAKDVWDVVRETYSDLENSSQIFELKTKLWQLNRGIREVTIYYNEMVTLWQELDQCYDDTWKSPTDCKRQMKREENDRVYMFLAGLNRSLDEVRGRILGRKPLPSIREVFSEVRREESRRRIMLHDSETSVSSISENSALVSRGLNSEEDRRKKPWCEHCKKPWHTKETCWKIHGKPQNWKKEGWKRRSSNDGRAFQATNEEEQIKSDLVSFTKEQLEHLYKILQSPQPFSNPSCSLAQKGLDLGEDDWQC